MVNIGTVVLKKHLNKKRRVLQMKQNELFHVDDLIEAETLRQEIIELEMSIAQLEVAIDII